MRSFIVHVLNIMIAFWTPLTGNCWSNGVKTGRTPKPHHNPNRSVDRYPRVPSSKSNIRTYICMFLIRLNKRTKPKLLRLTSNDYNLRERVGSLSVKICKEIERDILKNSKEYNNSLKKINYVDAIFLQTWPFYISSTVGVFICAHILCFFSI